MRQRDEHMSKKIFIKNRKRQKMAVLVENPKGRHLVFVMHGLGASRNQPLIRKIADIFLKNDFKVITFDTTNSSGESAGSYNKATFTGYYEDLEDVISWAKTQSWYEEPFYLSGHSLGGMSVLLYYVNHLKKVKAIAPIATSISGKLTLTTKKNRDWKEWKKKGYNEYIGTAGKLKRMPWSHYEDRLKYDILKHANKIKIPILMIVGDKDEFTPVKHQKMLFDKLKTDKEIHVIKGAEHNFEKPNRLIPVYNIFNKWIKRVIK